MKRISFALCGIWLALTSCRASFESLTNPKNSETADQVPEMPNRGSSEATPEMPTVAVPDSPILQEEKVLPIGDETGKECEGTMIALEEGRDLNFDGILQAGEVLNTTFVCDEERVPETDPKQNPEPNQNEAECPAQQESSDCPDQSD